MTEHRALCGWLLKQDAKSLWRGWKKRWFQQLHDYNLYYFPTCTTDTSLSKGFIDIKSIVNVQAVETASTKNVFHVMTHDRTYVLQANSEDEVQYWISGLNGIVASISQPLTTLISKAELFDLQQEHIKHENEERQKRAKGDKSARAMSVRYPPLSASPANGEMRLSRSSSMQNITYIDYDPQNSTPNSSLSSSIINNYTGNHNNNINNGNNSPPMNPSHQSLSSIQFPTASSFSTNSNHMNSNNNNNNKNVNNTSPPQQHYNANNKSVPPSPQKQQQQQQQSSSSSTSSKFLDIVSGKPTSEQEVEKEKIEKKKWASMRDIQALIVREKDAEIARLSEEVARVNEMHEKAIESTKQLRLDHFQQLEQQKIEENERIIELEKKYLNQISELTQNMKKREEECENANNERDRAIDESEIARAQLVFLKTDWEQRINLLESEIKLKENVITQLNSKITTLNGELSAKDTLLKNSMHGITYPQAFDDVLTVAQLEKERETRHAFQEQCAFLGQEVFKLETELKQHKILIAEQKNNILERAGSGGNISATASPMKNNNNNSNTPHKSNNNNNSHSHIHSGNNSYNSNNGSYNSSNNNVLNSPSHASVADFSRIQAAGANSEDLDASQINILLVENEALRQKYFMSVGRSLKLQTTMTGGYSNISIADLYYNAVEQNLSIDDWPNFISNQLAPSLKQS